MPGNPAAACGAHRLVIIKILGNNFGMAQPHKLGYGTSNK